MIPRNWWPHVQLRYETTWRGQAWLHRHQPQATLEFADRVEVYDLSAAEYQQMTMIPYNDRIATLLRRRPDRVIGKAEQVANAGFASIFSG